MTTLDAAGVSTSMNVDHPVSGDERTEGTGERSNHGQTPQMSQLGWVGRLANYQLGRHFSQTWPGGLIYVLGRPDGGPPKDVRILPLAAMTLSLSIIKGTLPVWFS